MSEEAKAKVEAETVNDDITGKSLDYAMVVASRRNDTEALVAMGEWQVVPLSQCVSQTQKQPIR